METLARRPTHHVFPRMYRVDGRRDWPVGSGVELMVLSILDEHGVLVRVGDLSDYVYGPLLAQGAVVMSPPGWEDRSDYV